MRAGFMAMMLLYAGCTVGGKGSDIDTVVVDDTEVDPPDTDGSDTDGGWGVETGWQESAAEETGFQPNDSSDSPNTDSVSSDTGACPFGEKLDCDEECFPAYFIGDGTCDDGATFQSNFNCVQYNFDGGDCRADTGTITVDSDTGCLFEVIMHVLTWSNEIGWEIRDANGRVVYEVFAGTYADNNRDYVHPVYLEPGEYTFVMIDSFGDGWHNGFFEVIVPGNGDVLATGTIPTGNQGTVDFTTECEYDPGDTDAPLPVTCGDVEVKIETQGWGGEISWDIKEGATTRAEGDGYLSYETYTERVALGEGSYHFRLFDAFGDGWADGTYTVTDLFTGDVLSTGTLLWGDYSSRAFALSCSTTFDPVIDDSDAPPPPIGVEITCDTVVLAVSTGDDGVDAGWILRDANGTIVDSRDAGSYQPNTTYFIEVPIGSGTWTLESTDAGGDGWEGGNIEVIDVDSGASLASLPAGETSVEFEADCGGVVVAPDDTGIEIDTGLCAPGATLDCGGICWPESFIGDGFCDDGTIFAPDFFCAENTFDGGDCSTGN